MQVIYTEKCSKCGYNIRNYSNKGGKSYFGPRFIKCPSCGTYYHNSNGIELSVLENDEVNRYCREYTLQGNSTIVILGTIVVLYLLSILVPGSDNWVDSHQYLSLAITVGVGATIFGLTALFKYIKFWKFIYPESVKRMDDPQYIEIIKRWNKERFGK